MNILNLWRFIDEIRSRQFVAFSRIDTQRQRSASDSVPPSLFGGLDPVFMAFCSSSENAPGCTTWRLLRVLNAFAEQLLQQFRSHVLMWQSADFFREFRRQHGHVWSIDSGGLVDDDHIVLSSHQGR